MSNRRGPRTRSQSAPDGGLNSTPEVTGESSDDLRQRVAELQGSIAGLTQVINHLVRNQEQRGQIPRSSDGSGGSGGQPPVQTVPVAPEVRADAGMQLLRDFMAFRPPEFHGGVDAAAAENWMLAMEKHLRSIGCADEHRVRLVTFLFRGDAERWWEMARQRFGDREPSWVEFREVFDSAYCPEWVREQKTYDFIELVQGTKTMAECEAKFIALADMLQL